MESHTHALDVHQAECYYDVTERGLAAHDLRAYVKGHLGCSSLASPEVSVERMACINPSASSITKKAGLDFEHGRVSVPISPALEA